MKKRVEVSYYQEIMDFIKTQIESNFLASDKPLKVYSKTGELRKGLQEIIRENGITSPSIVNFASQTPPLSLDIFTLVTDGTKFQLLIEEIKLLSSVGLTQLSQLIGYTIVARAKYGLLINVNGGESPRLTNLLLNDPDLLHTKQILLDGKEVTHCYGVMEWEPMTKNLIYTGHGPIGTMADLCGLLEKDFDTL